MGRSVTPSARCCWEGAASSDEAGAGRGVLDDLQPCRNRCDHAGSIDMQKSREQEKEVEQSEVEETAEQEQHEEAEFAKGIKFLHSWALP